MNQGAEDYRPRKGKKYQQTIAAVQAYERGLNYDLGDIKARAQEWLNDTIGWARGSILPRMARNASHVALGELHQRVGMPPTTVGGETLRRPTFDSRYAPYTNWQLQDHIRALRNQADSINDRETQQALLRKAADMTSELASRGANSVIAVNNLPGDL